MDKLAVQLFMFFFYLFYRTFSPIVFGALYSLSLSDAAQHIGFPVDFHLIFFLFSFGFLLTMILTALFPKRLNKQRK